MTRMKRMIRTLVVVCAAGLLVAAVSAAQDLSGKWTMKVSGGPHEVVVPRRVAGRHHVRHTQRRVDHTKVFERRLLKVERLWILLHVGHLQHERPVGGVHPHVLVAL